MTLPLFNLEEQQAPAGLPGKALGSDTTATESERVAARRSELVSANVKAFRCALEHWETDRDKYWESIEGMRVTYALLALLSDGARSEVKVLRLSVAKEIVAVEKEMQRLRDRIDVTRGSGGKLWSELETVGHRHLRLCDQLEAIDGGL